MGHIFSKNQQDLKNTKRQVEYEIDSDTFAVEQCDISPYVLESALAKTYQYDISNARYKKDLTQERLDRYVGEMTARKRNAERLIRKFESREIR